MRWVIGGEGLQTNICLPFSVRDPDPPDPHVFGPPGSGSICQRYGSGSFCHHAKNKKNLDSYYFVTLFDFLSLENYVNVLSNSNKQKKCLNKNFFLVGILKVNDQKSRIRIH
jgi:hypothetical protein